MTRIPKFITGLCQFHAEIKDDLAPRLRKAGFPLAQNTSLQFGPSHPTHAQLLALAEACREGGLAGVVERVIDGSDHGAFLGLVHVLATSVFAPDRECDAAMLLRLAREGREPEPAAQDAHTPISLVARFRALAHAGIALDSPAPRAPSLLMAAAQADNAACVEALLAAGARADAMEYGLGVAHLAASHGATRVLVCLAAHGVPLGEADESHAGNTPLHHAARGGHAGAVSALIAAGVDVAQHNGQRKTALQLAGEARQFDAIKALVGLPDHVISPPGKTVIGMILEAAVQGSEAFVFGLITRFGQAVVSDAQPAPAASAPKAERPRRGVRFSHSVRVAEYERGSAPKDSVEGLPWQGLRGDGKLPHGGA